MNVRVSATNLIYAAVLASPVLAQGTHYEWLVATDTEAGRVRVIDAARLTPEKDYFIGRIEGVALGPNCQLYYLDESCYFGLARARQS